MEGVCCKGASPQLHGEGNCSCFLIKELLRSYKASRMKGASSKRATLLLQEGMAGKGFVIRKFYFLLLGESVWKVFVTT